MPTVGLATELKRNLLTSTFGRKRFNSIRAESCRLPKMFRYLPRGMVILLRRF